MTIARATREALADTITRARRELRDPVTNAAGDAIVAGSLRFKASDVQDALNDALIEMQVLMHGQSPGEALINTGTLVAPSDGNINISADVGDANGIYAVWRQLSSGILRQVEYVSPEESERYNQRATTDSQHRKPKYTLTSDEDGETILKVRPAIEGRCYVVSYVAAPLVVTDWTTAGADNGHVLSRKWRELLGLEAACKLLDPNGEMDPQQMMRLNRKRTEFRRFSRRRQGRAHMQNRRRLRAT